MAEEEEQDTAPEGVEGEEPKKSKKKVLLGGGMLGLIAAAYMAAMAAVPKKAEYKVFEGPFVAPLAAESFTANLAGKGHKRFLLIELNALFDAFDEAYVTARTEQPIYQALVTNTILGVASKYDETIMNEDVGKVFLEELEIALDPVLFPVHVGKTPTPLDSDPKSGIKLGLSAADSDLRGSLYDHHLTIDAVEKKLRLDKGPPVLFEGTERDLRLENERGDSVYIDVTDLKPDFQGQVMVGVHGQLRELLKEKFNLQ